jgi:hypothetical protein
LVAFVTPFFFNTEVVICCCAEAIERERSSPDSFSAQPYHYMELACLLLEHAKDAFTGSDDYFKVSCTAEHRAQVCVWTLV